MKFFLLLPDFANSLPCWQQNWASQQGRKLAKSGSNKKDFDSANLILMSIGKSGIIKQLGFYSVRPNVDTYEQK